MTDKSKQTNIITLVEVCKELKIAPIRARKLLRIKSKDIKTFPEVGKGHIAKTPWRWVKGSNAHTEAIKILSR